jgi:opacity protein-like surface antigen
LFATALAVGAVVGSARVNAADLATQAYRSPPVVAPIYNWTGIYVGANAGYGFGKQDPLGLFSNDCCGLQHFGDVTEFRRNSPKSRRNQRFAIVSVALLSLTCS